MNGLTSGRMGFDEIFEQGDRERARFDDEQRRLLVELEPMCEELSRNAELAIHRALSAIGLTSVHAIRAVHANAHGNVAARTIVFSARTAGGKGDFEISTIVSVSIDGSRLRYEREPLRIVVRRLDRLTAAQVHRTFAQIGVEESKPTYQLAVDDFKIALEAAARDLEKTQ